MTDGILQDALSDACMAAVKRGLRPGQVIAALILMTATIAARAEPHLEFEDYDAAVREMTNKIVAAIKPKRKDGT